MKTDMLTSCFKIIQKQVYRTKYEKLICAKAIIEICEFVKSKHLKTIDAPFEYEKIASEKIKELIASENIIDMRSSTFSDELWLINDLERELCVSITPKEMILSGKRKTKNKKDNKKNATSIFENFSKENVAYLIDTDYVFHVTENENIKRWEENLFSLLTPLRDYFSIYMKNADKAVQIYNYFNKIIDFKENEVFMKKIPLNKTDGRRFYEFLKIPAVSSFFSENLIKFSYCDNDSFDFKKINLLKKEVKENIKNFQKNGKANSTVDNPRFLYYFHDSIYKWLR